MTHSILPTELRLRGPADLIAAVPYLLGFQPSDSLVLVGLDRGRLVVTAHAALPAAFRARSPAGFRPGRRFRPLFPHLRTPRTAATPGRVAFSESP